MHHQWPHELVKKLSSLLKPLVLQGSGISLERLQIVSVSIGPSSDLVESEAVLVADPDNDALRLTQTLVFADGKSARVAMHYFVRGRRQFFRPAVPTLLPHESAMPRIAADDIKTFFIACDEDNSALYDKDLAQLTGRRDVMIPSLMLLVRGLELLIERGEIATHSNIDATFFRAVYAGQHLSVGHASNEHDRMLQIFADDELVLSLVVNQLTP